MTSISFKQAKGKRVLILGDVGTGKTSLTQRLLREALEEGATGITVIDMAPGKIVVNDAPIGGYLLDKPDSRVRYLAPKDVKAPRLTAKNPEELIELAEKNRIEIESLLDTFSRNPGNILFVNDASIYLQRGNLNTLWAALLKAKTLVINSYLGERLKSDQGTGISAREKDLVLELVSKMDVVIKLE